MANGTDGRVYGGDPELVHVPDGQRKEVGNALAAVADTIIRQMGQRSYDNPSLPLCPGCYMVVGFNMMVELAKANGQSLQELGNTMSKAFSILAGQGVLDSNACLLEEIEVILDPGVAEDIRLEIEDDRYAG